MGVFLPPSPTAAKNDTVLPAYRRKRVASEIEARVASFPRDALCGIDPAALPFLVVTTQEDMDAALQLWENEARGLVAGVPALVPVRGPSNATGHSFALLSLFVAGLPLAVPSVCLSTHTFIFLLLSPCTRPST